MKDFNIFKYIDYFIVLDSETNGLKPNDSVLQLCAIKYRLENKKFQEVDLFNRFYLPKEKFNPFAIAVNGLNEEKIIELRKNVTYPKQFDDDVDFYYFCSDIKLFIGHNIQFDLKRISFLQERSVLDTMLLNTDVLKIPSGNKYKYPKLNECAEYYGIINSNEHDALEDARTTAKILEIMINKNLFNNNTLEW